MAMRVLSIAFLTAAVSCGGDGEKCGVPELGPNAAARLPFQISFGDGVIQYGEFRSSPNNDCPTDGSPTSVTIAAVQTKPEVASTFFFTLCLPQPEKLTGKDGVAEIDFSDETLVQLVDTNGESDGCTLRRGQGQATGTIRFFGVCDDTNHPSGFLLDINGSAPGTLTCPDQNGGTTETAFTLDFNGAAEVSPVAID